MKKLALSGLIALSALSASLVHAASPTVVGSFNITFYLETGRSTGATQCINFVSAPGTVAGVPTSGTWSSPTFPGWHGEWIQLGDHVRFFGLTDSLATTESGNMISKGNFGGVSFNHYSKTTTATSSAGSFKGLRVTSCTGLKGSASTLESDPAKDSRTDGNPNNLSSNNDNVNNVE